jgi:hypothetical protein
MEVLGENTKNFKKLASKEVLLANITLINRERKKKRSRGEDERGGPHQRGENWDG